MLEGLGFNLISCAHSLYWIPEFQRGSDQGFGDRRSEDKSEAKERREERNERNGDNKLYSYKSAEVQSLSSRTNFRTEELATEDWTYIRGGRLVSQ